MSLFSSKMSFKREKEEDSSSLQKPTSLVSHEDLAFAPPVQASWERRISRSSTLLTSSILVFFLVFCLWASFFKLDEVTRCEGRIIAPGHVQVIDNLEGGIIGEILVKEGQTVHPNQVLVRIKNVGISSELEETREHYYRKKAAAERLRAEIEGREFVPSADLFSNAPTIGQEELNLFKLRKSQYEKQEEILKLQAAQKKSELQELLAKQHTLKDLHGLSSQELRVWEPLLKEKLVPLTDFLRHKRELSDLTGQLKGIESALERTQSSINEAEERLREAQSQRLSQNSIELRNTLGDLSGLEHMKTARHDRVYRSEVRSPVYGIVQNMKINTIGGVIKSGQSLLEIVPLEASLLIEGRVMPADIAFIHPGLKARIKLSAYDYSIYGGLDGEVVTVSADTLTDDKGVSFYKIDLKTEKNHLLSHGKELPIIPGMTASIDILTNKKTIMQYLLKPFFKIRQNALQER